jgi:hypothetical protein
MRTKLISSLLIAGIVSAAVLTLCWFAASFLDKRPSAIAMVHRFGLLSEQVAVEWLLADLSGENLYPPVEARQALKKINPQWTTLPTVSKIHNNWLNSIESGSAIDKQRAVTGEVNLAGDLPDASLTVLDLQLQPGTWLYSRTSAQDLSPEVKEHIKNFSRQCNSRLLTILNAAMNSGSPERIRKACESASVLCDRLCPAFSESVIAHLADRRADISKPLIALYQSHRAELTNVAPTAKSLDNIVANLMTWPVDRERYERLQLLRSFPAIATNTAGRYLRAIGTQTGDYQRNALFILKTLFTMDRLAAEETISILMRTDDVPLNLELLQILRDSSVRELDPPVLAFNALKVERLKSIALERFDFISPSFAKDWGAYTSNYLDRIWTVSHGVSSLSPFSSTARQQDRMTRALDSLTKRNSGSSKKGLCSDFLCIDESQAKLLEQDPARCLFVLFVDPPSGRVMMSSQSGVRAWPYPKAQFRRAPNGWLKLVSLEGSVLQAQASEDYLTTEQLAHSGGIPIFAIFITTQALESYGNLIVSELQRQVLKPMDVESFSWPQPEWMAAVWLANKKLTGKEEMSWGSIIALMAGSKYRELGQYVNRFESDKLKDATWIERAAMVRSLGEIALIEPSALQILAKIAKEDPSFHVRRVAQHGLKSGGDH